jgi:hypothetical protein
MKAEGGVAKRGWRRLVGAARTDEGGRGSRGRSVV